MKINLLKNITRSIWLTCFIHLKEVQKFGVHISSAITRLRLNQAYIPITTHFFNNQNNENIYKLFIYFIGTMTFDEIDFYNDSDYSKTLYKFEENKLEPMQNIENNRFISFLIMNLQTQVIIATSK